VHSENSADAKNIDSDEKGVKVEDLAMSEWMERIGRTRARFIPKSSSNSFPVSAVEWNASASMAELPVKKAARYLKIAIVRLETMAT
jgi:hypothetical protein